jgi:hypothetical protein
MESSHRRISNQERLPAFRFDLIERNFTMLARSLATIAAVALVTGFVAVSSAGSAFAETAWDASHQRRDQVNDRMRNENQRINQERREGEIGRGQARQLHREDHQIRNEERRMAARDGSHITRFDQRVLNRQENRVSRQIGR